MSIKVSLHGQRNDAPKLRIDVRQFSDFVTVEFGQATNDGTNEVTIFLPGLRAARAIALSILDQTGGRISRPDDITAPGAPAPSPNAHDVDVAVGTV